jgi:hypothetical protein
LGLAFDAARGCGLVLEALLRDSALAAFALTVGAFSNPLERMFHLLAVLVEEMDQGVRCRSIQECLSEVNVLGNRPDHPADGLGQRFVEPGLLAACVGQVL